MDLNLKTEDGSDGKLIIVVYCIQQVIIHSVVYQHLPHSFPYQFFFFLLF